MTLTRLNEIPGLKVGDRVVCTSTNGHSNGKPRSWWTVGKTYTVARIDSPYQPRVPCDSGCGCGISTGYFAPAPRETVEDAERADPADQAELIASLRQVIADMEDKGGEPAADTGWDAEVKSLSFAGRTLQAWTLHDVTVNPEGAFAAINTIANRLAALISAARGETQ